MFLLLLAALFGRPAEAGVRVAVSSPGVEIVVSPFSPTYVPAARPGYVWVPGYYDPYGFYVPGTWEPIAHRAGYIWVPGYWIGASYYDGYWRPRLHADDVWVAGYYAGGRYVPARWVPRREVDEARRREAHEREEARAHRHEPHGHTEAHGHPHH